MTRLAAHIARKRLRAESLPVIEQIWQRRRMLGWALATTFALGIAGQWWPGYVERTIAPGEIRQIEGHSYHVEPLGLGERLLFNIRFDSNDTPASSMLSIREDGRALPAPHALHATIAAEGRGRFSHWGNSLYFSASDNSDPRSNQRRYVVRAPLEPSRKLLAIIVVAMVLGALGALSAAGVPLATWSAGNRARPGVSARSVAEAATIGVGAIAVAVLATFAYALLFDRLAAMQSARQTVLTMTSGALWAACGVVAARVVQRRGAGAWRLMSAIVVLFATGWMLSVRAQPFNTDVLNLTLSSVMGPVALGALLVYLVGSARWGAWEDALATAGHPRLWTGAIVLALALASPMIWTPVLEHWNASGWMDSHAYDVYAHNILSGKAAAGNSQYMPLYQYGLAAVYYVFGHVFFAQQLVNVALAFLTVLALCFSAWNLFRNLWAVLLAGVWGALTPQLFYAVHFSQIESWYTPIVALSILAWTAYWRSPSTPHLVLVALAAAAGINTRNQGAFYFAWLCLAPFFITTFAWSQRMRHAALAIVILAASLVPWSLRNYAIDGRLSPSAARNAYYVAALNDPRIGFYGLRYWEGWSEITQEYDRRYPDPAERDRAMMSAGLSAPYRNFGWFREALFWRTLAFYGLVPNGLLAPDRPVPTDWATHWVSYVYWRITPLVLLPLSLIGLVTRPGRTTGFLAVAVLANLAVVALSAAAEDRVSYPVLPMHMLLMLAAIFRPAAQEMAWHIVPAVAEEAKRRVWIVAGAAVLLCIVIARVRFGEANLYAPLVERQVFVNADVTLDPTLPSLNERAAAPPAPPLPEAAWDGRAVRLRLIALNYQCPPKYAGRVAYLPEFATDPAGETYYCATLPVGSDGKQEHLRIAVAWFGARVNEPLREGDEVEAEGRLLIARPNPIATYWVRIEKARKVAVRSTEVPAFF